MKTKIHTSDQIRNFAMRNFQLESDLINLENKGYEIGHLATIQKKEVVDPDLFEMDIRQSAKRMVDYFALCFCFENTVRRMIKQTLSEKYGTDWWETKVPDAIKNEVKSRQEKEKDSVMTVRSYDDPLLYITLGELIPIIEYNWEDFSDQLRSKRGVKQILTQLNQSRALVAHSVELTEDEADRMKLAIKDWQRQQT